MKIAIVQTRSVKGNVRKNIENHLRFIERAISLKANIVFFPELSITGYEPYLAKELATDFHDVMFSSFQELSDTRGISVGIGMPTKATNGINISMLIFQPKQKRIVYSKQILHADELPFFVGGNENVFLNIEGKKIAIGICYETLHRNHYVYAKNEGADIFIASVAKPKNGVEKAYKHFASMAKEFKTPILMSNCVGPCDDFESKGQSAVWNERGELIEQLDSYIQGILVFDNNSKIVYSEQLIIDKASLNDLGLIHQIYYNVREDLRQKAIFQWTDHYPSISILESDLKKEKLFILKNKGEILGAINISEEQEYEYQNIRWKSNPSKVLVIHRLIVNPKQQGNGFGNLLMDFAENYAAQNNYTSIRLDVYSQNRQVVEFYQKRNYLIRGEVIFPERELPFYCMEYEVKYS